MFRTAAAAALLLAALAVTAFAQKDKDEKKAKLYKTPQECFDAFNEAEAKQDYKTWVGCLAPRSQTELASLMLAGGIGARAELNKEKDEKKRAAVAKQMKPVFDVLDKHGLTEKATKGVDSPDDAKKTLGKVVKDLEGFLIDMAVASDKVEDKPKEKKDKPKLADVKIDGDKATANEVRPSKKGKDEKTPVSFVKVKGGWRIDPFALDEKESKDKSEK
jgi:cytochrome c556